MRMGWLVVGLALVGCKGSNDDIGGTDNPDILQTTLEELEAAEECESFTTSEGLVCDDLEGGSTYLMANLVFGDGGQLGGDFFYVVVANGPFLTNDSWQSSDAHANGLDYCTVAFGLTGSWEEGGTPECNGCTHTISYNTTYSVGDSDCPEGLNRDIRQTADGVEGAYWGVTVAPDGSATAVDTSRVWATNGIGDDSGAIIWSDFRCAYYGSSECS